MGRERLLAGYGDSGGGSLLSWPLPYHMAEGTALAYQHSEPYIPFVVCLGTQAWTEGPAGASCCQAMSGARHMRGTEVLKNGGYHCKQQPLSSSMSAKSLRVGGKACKEHPWDHV